MNVTKKNLNIGSKIKTRQISKMALFLAVVHIFIFVGIVEASVPVSYPIPRLTVKSGRDALYSNDSNALILKQTKKQARNLSFLLFYQQ